LRHCGSPHHILDHTSPPTHFTTPTLPIPVYISETKPIPSTIMPSATIFKQLQYAYVGSAYIFFDDCDFTWTIGTTQQRDLDPMHVAKLVESFEAQGIQQVAPENHISVTVKLSSILEYGTEERQALGIRLRKEPPLSDARLDDYPRFQGFFAATGVKFEVQAGMHRLHAIHEFASRQALLQPPVIIDQGFVTDVYDPRKLFSLLRACAFQQRQEKRFFVAVQVSLEARAMISDPPRHK